MTDVQMLREYLPLLLPLAVIEIGLMIAGLISVFRHPHYRFGNRIVWVLLILLVQPLGALAYFFFGREAA